MNERLFCLFEGRWRQQKLQEIEITTRKGAFAPMTENGRIIINDMLASCHSDLRDVAQQSNLFNVWNNQFTTYKF